MSGVCLVVVILAAVFVVSYLTAWLLRRHRNGNL